MEQLFAARLLAWAHSCVPGSITARHLRRTLTTTVGFSAPGAVATSGLFMCRSLFDGLDQDKTRLTDGPLQNQLRKIISWKNAL